MIEIDVHIAHLLNQQLPEPAAVELGEAHELRGVELLNGLG